jgi:hypothetical protein
MQQKIIEMLTSQLPVEMIIKTNSVLQPDLYSNDVDLSYVVVLQKANQKNFDILHTLKQSISKNKKINVSFEVLTSNEIRLITEKKHSFLSGLLTIFLKLDKAKIIYSLNLSVDLLKVSQEDINFAGALCSQELVESFRKLFLKAKFVPNQIQSDNASQKKIREILFRETIIAKIVSTSQDLSSVLFETQLIINTPNNQSNYAWLNNAFSLSEKIHAQVIARE